MNQSGVRVMLESRQNYATTVFPGSSVKKNITMQAYTRQTIPWSLKCEIIDGITR